MNAAYEQSLGITTIRWLCKPCEAARKAAGWSSKMIREYIAFGCDDCHFREANKGT